MSISDWQQGLPYQLPLLKEIQAGILEKRGKRKRDGKFYDTDDRPTPKSLVLRVRGHDLQVVNDPRKLKLNLTTSEETMKWFVGEPWRDLHPSPIGDIAPDAPVNEPPAAEGEEFEAAGRKDFEQQLNAAVQETLVALSGHAAFLSVTWDKKNGRFRTMAEPRGSRAMYAPVKQYNKLLHGGSMVDGAHPI